MKKYLLSVILLAGCFFADNTLKAQVRVNLNVNIGAQPVWGPVGYEHVEYYYLPDIDAYYYVPQRQFIYLDGGRWIFAASLPPRYRGYDLYNGYKVVINDPYPYRHCDVYRERYGGYRGYYGRQEIIRDRPHWHDEYYEHPGRHGRGHAYGHYKHHRDWDDD